jgi:very-short-patch-repair endonuclease
METRLRMLFVLAGLPKPKVQASLQDEHGSFAVGPDLYYPIHRLAIEYDGIVHRDTLAVDNRRQNRLLEAGYNILRFTAGDVLSTTTAVVALVRRALSAAVYGAGS